MFEKSTEELTKMGAAITTAEIEQEPELWVEAFNNYKKDADKINQFLNDIQTKVNEPVRVIFTGAGSSAFVGNTIVPYLTRVGDTDKYIFEAIDTTKIVSAPRDYLLPDKPTILVSFARSGNSPESVATVDIAEKLVKQLWQLTITCAPDGKLAKHAEKDENNLVLLQPARSNDKGFAMTGSFSCMTLTAELVFDAKSSMSDKEKFAQTISNMGQEIVKREVELQNIVALNFDRLVYLGSGALGGLTQEAQLKILELTAGQVATLFETSMGFRHGPKSFVNDKTVLFDFISNDAYVRQYDIDILDEVKNDEIAVKTIAVGTKTDKNFDGDYFYFETGDPKLPEGYQALPDIMFAQTIALLTSIKVGNTPDTPSATGTVNRVVKGVTIHPLQ